MLSTCMFCKGNLGHNDVVEEFQVGRRLAFDPERGRLWAVCPHCERWNLSPWGERWEAIEACERVFRETKLRVSTENIGLARHLEGLDLVRIGDPHRTEFAAWRYGDQFGKRRKKAVLIGVGVTAGLVGLNFAGPLLIGGSGIGGYWIWNMGNVVASIRARTKVRTDDGRLIKLKLKDYKSVRLLPADEGDGFALAMKKKGDPSSDVWTISEHHRHRYRESSIRRARRDRRERRNQEVFTGAEARRLAGQIIPKINRNGGGKSAVRDAVRQIETAGHPEAFLEAVTGHRKSFSYWSGEGGYVTKMPTPTKLALEMALHEEDERRALEGELWRLERAWEEAEEIAAISDDLFVSDWVRERFNQMKRKAVREGHRSA